MPAFIIALLSTCLFVYGLFDDVHILRLCTKPIPVLLLLWMVYRNKRRDLWTLGALCFSLIGDVILELPNIFPFALGLLSFLFAHLFYIRRFLHAPTQKIWWPLLPISMYCISLFTYMTPNLGPLMIPVGVYVFVIATMLWSACVYTYTTKQYLLLAGAILFVMSDSLIAINKFITPFSQARYAIIVTYWVAQYMIVTPLLSQEEQ